MKSKAEEVAEELKKTESIHIVTHIDADGISSGSIAYETMKRAGKEVTIEFVKQLENEKIEELKDEGHEKIWFTDLGSGQLKYLKGVDCVITDHHVPQGKVMGSDESDRGNILSYCKPSITEFNPHRFGVDGALEISGSGMAYLVAREMGDNKDLSKLAVLGAVGDLQARKHGKLVGKNREILQEGVDEGYIVKSVDTLLYGVESRPISKVLEYASDPVLPGLTGDTSACANFLVEMDTPLKEDDEWRSWYQLSKEEKRRILSTLAKKLIERGFPASYADSLIGEVYTFPDEEFGTMLHEAKEFSTVLNSCGRYGKGKIGLEVCLGDRDEYLEKAKDLLKGHQRVLVDCMKYVKSIGVEERDHLQFFHGKDQVPDTVLGTVAGMVLSSGEVDRNLAMFAFARSTQKDGIKVSSRGTKRLVDRGLDLSEVMSKCSNKFGGDGGGHDIAAGAHIPQGKEEEFLQESERMLKKQLD